ncbi:unnamed protein product [Symbiodinium microadriaticum]|nr:unnamed protein product [Symbiodinium microadriaticum]CAE7366861.1 unnamed protein product [Symbiodinium sp. KB8]
MTTLKKQLRRRCKHKTWAPFSHEELQRTSNSWAHNRSTGPDGISHEAAKALLADIQWGGKLAYLLNDMFYTAHIPESIDRGITVLLPKIPCPLEWGDTRPITLSSTLLKWASQLLLARAGGHIRSGSLLQWARAGRQGVELVATIRRVTQMARDWGIGTWLVKLDIRKAFDSVWQHRMGGLVAARVGGVASDRNPVPPELGDCPWEALFWLSILETRTLNVAIADSITTVNGIRQGSPDSPDLFGAIVARDLQTAISRAPTQPLDSKGGPPPPRVGGSFLDDTYLWSQDRTHLQRVLHNLEGELAQDGLHIHPVKTAILYSKPTGGGTFEKGGETVACSDHRTVISTLGSPNTFHDQTAALIAEMSRRSRNAFRKHKQILTARTSIKSRAKAYLTLVRNAGLYACETWPPHRNLLKAVNSMQTQHFRDMLHINRLPTEEWASWNTRSLRQAPHAWETRQEEDDRGQYQQKQQQQGKPDQRTDFPPESPAATWLKPIPGMTMVEHYEWVRRAILTQLQVIRDTASSLPGADLLVAMMDIAAQLVHSVPTAAPAAPEHSGEQTHERGQRGRKRPLTEPNALAEIMRYAASAGGEREPLPPNLMAEDLFFLMAELEAGALQLHEPLPGDIDIRTVQDAARRVQHTIHLLCSARDQSLAGGDKWNRPQFWREIAELVEPAVLIIDRRGDAFADDDGADLAHPADVAVLAREVPEAPARTGQTSSAALLLRDAADDFRCIVPSMVGEQQTLAVQLLQAVDYWFQAQFGGALAVHDGTQTDDMGDPLQSHVGENRPPATTGELAGGPAEERPTVQQQEDSYNSEPFTASKLGLYQECMEPLAASSQPAGGEDAGPMEHWRGWLGLQHTTASQAEAALGSLDLDALGEPTLPVAPASSLEQEVGSVLGHYCAMAPTPAGGSNRQLSACDASGPGRGEWRQQ